MGSWPPISDPQLRERLALGDREFERHYLDFAAGCEPRSCGPEQLVRALGYPWERPAGSFVLREGRELPLAGLAAAERERALAEIAGRPDRVPLLAIGSNASPAVLAGKLARLEPGEDRELLALTGHLHDHDVGPAAQLALYGSLPATIFPSPGTAVETALLWVTAAQLELLAASELNYRFGRLRARFEVAQTGERHEEVGAFVCRFGCFAPDGEPLALAAVPARSRRAAALSQADLLDRAAAVALGPGSGGEELVRAVHEDPGGVAPRIAATIWKASVHPELEGWEPL